MPSDRYLLLVGRSGEKVQVYCYETRLPVGGLSQVQVRIRICLLYCQSLLTASHLVLAADSMPKFDLRADVPTGGRGCGIAGARLGGMSAGRT